MTPLFVNSIHSISWIIALFVPGSALLLVEKNKLAFTIPIIGLVWVAFISWSRWVVSPTGFLIMLLGLFALHGLSYGFALKTGFKQNYTPINKVLGAFTLLCLLNICITVSSHFYKDSWFGFAFYHIPSESMSPSLKAGDVVMVNTWSYRDKPLQINDILVLKRSEKSIALAKRLSEIRQSNNKTELYVTGDNEYRSIDSRRFGWISDDYLIGKVEFIWFSFDGFDRQLIRVD